MLINEPLDILKPSYDTLFTCRATTLLVRLGKVLQLVQDLPPFCIADGTPAEVRAINKVGLERNGFSAGQLDRVKAIYRTLYRDGLNRTQALEKLAADVDAGSGEYRQMLEFARSSSRGLAPGGRG